MKKWTIMMFAVILAIALVGCGTGNLASAEEPTEPVTSAPTEMTTPQLEVPEVEVEVEMDSFTLDDILPEDYKSPEELAAIQEEEENKQFLHDSVHKELWIGFENYGIEVHIIGTDAYVLHANNEWDIHALCANNTYLEKHDVRFHVPKGSAIVRFVPPTLESCGYVEDDESTWVSIGECRGYVWESELDSVTAIRWDSKLIIEIDSKYHIYVNYKNELPENADICYGIN